MNNSNIHVWDRTGSGHTTQEFVEMMNSQPERFETLRTTSHVFEYDRQLGTLRITSAGDEQQCLSSADETAVLLMLLSGLSNDILLRGDADGRA